MVLASISILVVEHTPSNALTSITVQGKSQLTLASLWGSVGLVSESYPVSIHTTASVLPLCSWWCC